jgi:thiol-disulfide isomerase/thioredoxin
MNTQGPLTWDSFKGKVVVVDLFAHWCGPCRNDYPTLVQVAGQKDPNLVVLGIHVAHGADDDAKIQQLFKDFKITYPVYLDVDGGEGEMGKLAGALGVRAIPHTFTIGPDGKVVAHGTLGEALDAAYKLTRDLKK